MNLRNILLPAVLFLSVGLASAVAEDPLDEDARRETIFTFGGAVPEGDNAYARFLLDAAENDPLCAALLLRYGGAAEMENGGFSVDYERDGAHAVSQEASGPDDAASAAEAGSGKAATAGSAAFRNHGDDARRAYDFAISFEDSVTEEIGIAGREDGAEKNVFSVAETGASDDSRLLDKGTAVLFFEKNACKNGQISSQFIVSSSRLEDSEEEDGILSLSTPIALLLVALGGGIVIVIHTVADHNKQ
ncbi:MAG: hypothetical protein IKQ16_10185 [Lentisphaeria bacterium]|nr:hypothetical protein [Lentisphaeria bacterium]